MADILFKHLTRGIKLMTDHIYKPLSEVANLLTVTGVENDNMKSGNGTFRVHLTFPLLHEKMAVLDNERATVLTAPFILPPFQEEFSLTNANIGDYILREVSVSHDTRSEPGRVSGVDLGGGPSSDEGRVITTDATAYTMYLSEHEINATNFDRFSNQVFELAVPEIALIGEHLRANPIIQSGLDIPIRHDRSYLVEISPEKKDRAMFSITISLLLERKLTHRDSGVTVQNIPSHNGSFAPVAQSITSAVGDSLIKAEDVSGVNTGMSLIDRIIASRIWGGYRRDGGRQYAESILADAGYDVIAVPMFAGWCVAAGGLGSGVGSAAIDNKPINMPGALTGVANFNSMDRAIIPLQYPITIHHVIIAVNYSPGAVFGTTITSKRPSVADFVNEVGVGLLRGIRSSDFDIEQVAHASWDPTTITNYLVDRGDNRHDDHGLISSGYSWDLLSCPLVGAGGSGYKPQGHPIFAALGTTETAQRSDIGDAPHSPLTKGAEQALDIRWRMASMLSEPSTWPPTEMLVGYPGHWIYIICKKHLI